MFCFYFYIWCIWNTLLKWWTIIVEYIRCKQFIIETCDSICIIRNVFKWETIAYVFLLHNPVHRPVTAPWPALDRFCLQTGLAVRHCLCCRLKLMSLGNSPVRFTHVYTLGWPLYQTCPLCGDRFPWTCNWTHVIYQIWFMDFEHEMLQTLSKKDSKYSITNEKKHC